MGTACSKKAKAVNDASVAKNDYAADTVTPETVAKDLTPRERPRKTSTTRVRRLSVVNGEDDDPASTAVAKVVPAEACSPPKGANAGAAKSTRNRRLSVVTSEEMEKQAATEFKVTHVVEPVHVQTPQVMELNRLGRTTSSKSRLLFSTEISCLSQTGREPTLKKTNQDNCLAFEKFIRHGQSLYAAFDGHGPHGHTVSSFAKHRLPLLLSRRLPRRLTSTGSDDAVKEALRGVFAEVHESVCLPPIDAEFSGTTATVGVILVPRFILEISLKAVLWWLQGAKLHVAWVGDSRCVLGMKGSDGKVTAKDVTRDHKPDSAGERERIIASGGRVKRLTDEDNNEIGPSRVWLKYAWIPGLAMSRAIGDICAHQVGVSCDPDVSTTEITPAVSFLVMASDGVWEFVSSQEAVDIIADAPDAATACRKLIDESYHRWLMEENGVVDDITAVVVRFHHFPRLTTSEEEPESETSA